LDLPDDRNRPPVVVIAGPCRSGTTALLRSAAATGHTSYFQPLKRVIRSALVGENARFAIEPETSTVVMKETFGPFVAEEVDFDPLAVLRSKGYPAHQLSLVVTLRHPRELYSSWQRLYSANDSFDGPRAEIFTAAFRHSLALYHRARADGLTVTAFAVDNLPGTTSAEALRRLFDRHALRYTPRAVRWDGPSAVLDAAIRREPEPARFRAAGALDAVRHSTTYTPPPVSGAQQDPAAPEPPACVLALVHAYESFVTFCKRDLGEQ
jgi:hypothetical protein